MADNLKTKGNKFCSNHLKEKVKFLCEDCKEKVCITCASTIHKCHSLVGLKLIVQEKYNSLQDLAKKAKETKIPKVKEKLIAAEDTVKNIQKSIHTQIGNVLENGERLKALIETSTASHVSELQQYEKNITQQLEKFRTDSEAIIKEWEDFFKECTETAKSDNNVLIIDVENSMAHRTIEEPEFKLNYIPVQFVTDSKDEMQLIGELGHLVYEVEQTEDRSLFTSPKIEKFLDLDVEPMSIHKSGESSYVVSQYKSANLTIVGTNGSQKTLFVDTPMTEICVDPVTYQLYCVPLNKSNIRAVDMSTGKTTKLFDTKHEPYCLQVTNNGNHFIVGSYGKPIITLYDKTGMEIKSLEMDKNPQRIAVCRSSNKIAVLCGDRGVVVMESKLQHIHTYRPLGIMFGGSDIEFNEAGRLLVAEKNNSTVHVVDANSGNTLKVIDLEFNKKDMPCCLTTTIQQGDSNIIIGTYTRKLLSINYLD